MARKKAIAKLNLLSALQVQRAPEGDVLALHIAEFAQPCRKDSIRREASGLSDGAR
jgi:hypothetical protein